MDEESQQHAEYIRMQCVQAAVQLRPRAKVEDVIGVAMELEIYVTAIDLTGAMH